jgi:acyl-[acyl-carrier-protein] desaturase
MSTVENVNTQKGVVITSTTESGAPKEWAYIPPSPEVIKHAAIIKSLEPEIGTMLKGEKYLQSRTRLWHPSKFLPDMGTDEGRDKLIILQNGAKRLSKPALISVAGNTITEDAVSTYQTWNNRPEGTQDATGVDQHPLAIWSRKWTAEEYRHHLVLNRYLMLSGAVDMKALDISSESLIANGFDPKTGDDPYKFFMYTAIQERATWIAHKNTGKLAKDEEVLDLAEICDAVSIDEKRHERFYTDVASLIFKEDPVDAVIALNELDKAGILMPAAYMTDGEDVGPETNYTKLYDQFAKVAQLAGVYTAKDYYEVMKYFVLKTWKIDTIEFPKGETPEEIERIDQAKEAQLKLVNKYTKVDPDRRNEIIIKAIKKENLVYDFSWVKDDAA